MRLLIATTNAAKAREIGRVLDGLPLKLVTLSEIQGGSVGEAPDESGGTFAQNALLKARHYSAATGLPTVAEDSGLVIDVLGGRPGVASARYPGATYAEKFANLYLELQTHQRPWNARFVCALALVDQAPGTGHWALEKVLFTAEVEGEITPVPRGTNGFGYDPIFLYPPYARTLGEVSDDEKLAVSHRGKAFRQLRAWLEAHPSHF